MNEENTFYGKGADNLTRGYGVILLIAYIRETILDYDLKLTIGDKVFNLNFFVLGFVCLSVMIFAIIISKKRVNSNSLKLLEDYIEINSQEQTSIINIFNKNEPHKNTIVYYKDINYVELNSLDLKRQISLFRNTGIRGYFGYKDSFKDVYIHKKDGSTITFPELTNRKYFKFELASKGIKIIINDSILNKNSILIHKNKSQTSK